MRSKIALIFFYFSYLFFPHFTEQANKQMIAIIVDRELIINSSSGVKFYIPFGGVPSSRRVYARFLLLLLILLGVKHRSFALFSRCMHSTLQSVSLYNRAEGSLTWSGDRHRNNDNFPAIIFIHSKQALQCDASSENLSLEDVIINNNQFKILHSSQAPRSNAKQW